jgi:hypothetical protein
MHVGHSPRRRFASNPRGWRLCRLRENSVQQEYATPRGRLLGLWPRFSLCVESPAIVRRVKRSVPDRYRFLLLRFAPQDVGLVVEFRHAGTFYYKGRIQSRKSKMDYFHK